jgi:hypothetical protein
MLVVTGCALSAHTPMDVLAVGWLGWMGAPTAQDPLPGSCGLWQKRPKPAKASPHPGKADHATEDVVPVPCICAQRCCQRLSAALSGLELTGSRGGKAVNGVPASLPLSRSLLYEQAPGLKNK